jgi:voltage-gated potassium channel
MHLNPSTARRAGLVIGATTLAVSIAGAVLITVFDRDQFPSFGAGLWWSVQTITTVGYGDHVPTDTRGQIVAGAVMLTGIAFVAVVTAAISAAFVQAARRRRGRNTDDLVLERLERIERLLQELEARHPD